jgi:sacsin
MSTIKRFEPGEPYTVRLRGILTEYPPGISILMELLQNADDAGAKSIVLP